MQVDPISPKRKAEELKEPDPVEKKAKTEKDEFVLWTMLYEEPCDCRSMLIPFSVFGSKPGIPTWPEFEKLLSIKDHEERVDALCAVYEHIDQKTELDMGIVVRFPIYAFTVFMYY